MYQICQLGAAEPRFL